MRMGCLETTFLRGHRLERPPAHLLPAVTPLRGHFRWGLSEPRTRVQVACIFWLRRERLIIQRVRLFAEGTGAHARASSLFLLRNREGLGQREREGREPSHAASTPVPGCKPHVGVRGEGAGLWASHLVSWQEGCWGQGLGKAQSVHCGGRPVPSAWKGGDCAELFSKALL